MKDILVFLEKIGLKKQVLYPFLAASGIRSSAKYYLRRRAPIDPERRLKIINHLEVVATSLFNFCQAQRNKYRL